REPVGKKLKINYDNILVIEGIHGLNEKLTGDIPHDIKFKIYVSALTSMNIDDHNRIPSTDTRILRRIVRDNQFRGTSALKTILQWPSVRNGEGRYIFPYQESADTMFNSSHMVELGILKNYAEPLLKEIDKTSAAFAEAKRLLEFLSYFLPIDGSDLPKNSIIREFIGS
ncbi:MAG: nucleoside kinase, partial [Clostridiales bacterium]|nr:nucleoside kinase [Clostridiales bacterium]